MRQCGIGNGSGEKVKLQRRTETRRPPSVESLLWDVETRRYRVAFTIAGAVKGDAGVRWKKRYPFCG